jgi:outer membrane protein OmpA-like peptidoglycan-associated protein
VKRSRHVMFLHFILPMLAAVSALDAQTGPAAVKLAPDQAGCVDSKFLPKLLACRIDNCEKKDSDRRDIPVGEDQKGEAIISSVEGNSRSVMYECGDGTTPASIVEHAATALKTAGFEIPYRFSDAEASLTARKDDLWITVEAASRFYTLTEISSFEPDFEAATDAASMAAMMERYGHMPLNGVQFLAGRPDLTPESESILAEVVTMLNDHPTWHLRVEGHTDSTGSKLGNMTLSSKRAAAVANWLVTKGIKRLRLDPQGMADMRPIADNSTEEGRSKNRRIEIVKVPAP